ncbi:hippocampus abundant transcript 1 protein-like, partial [Limulus polyphemus]|uniref:Hippocampus abundant transcript 1 protein-like n=1 Tax=Limulus polyphemus TaxID=6850 RepID=A0ABM1TMN3_LIMPO
GFLSFFSAPIVGALSDVFGRKVFLLLAVIFTSSPIPLLIFNKWWYFIMISVSGVFAVTFSVSFAYVADVTEEQKLSFAYGLLSATFAASLVISPALGSFLSQTYSDNLVAVLASAIVLMDIIFILVAVPESLPAKLRPGSCDAKISWEQTDPFSALRKVGKDKTILMLCTTVFLSFLPEAGQFSCFFVYLRLVMGFSAEDVVLFIAVVGLLCLFAQTVILQMLMMTLGSKNTIMVGIFFELLQLSCYGFFSQRWIMWAAGWFLSMCSITYPAISAFASTSTEVENQGVAQGMITGMRGLCNGLGPAIFGFIFYLSDVDLNKEAYLKPFEAQTGEASNFTGVSNPELVPGPPFVLGACLVMIALLVTAFIPESQPFINSEHSSTYQQTSAPLTTTTSDSCLHYQKPFL